MNLGRDGSPMSGAFEIPIDGDRGALAAMRERKLATLAFRRAASPGRGFGAPADFLTPALVAEFGIPDAPPVSANEYGGPFVAEIRAHPERLCLDVGAGLRASCFANVVNVEIYPSASTDVLAVGEDLPFDDASFDYVLCCATLEHTRRPWDVAREICRVLKPGGRVLVDYPFLQGVHGYPHHYFNATPGGCVSLFAADCDIVSSVIERNNHPVQALCWILNEWRNGLPEPAREAFGRMTVDELLAAPADAQIDRDHCRLLAPAALGAIPAGSTMIARRRAAPLSARPGETALEAEIASLRASTSWRLTAPMRAIAKAARRVAGARPR